MCRQMCCKNNLIYRYLAVVVFLMLTILMVNIQQYNVSLNAEAGVADIQNFPLQVGKWHGKDIPLEEKIYDILETKSIIHRSFTTNTGENVFLSIVHYHDTKVDFHAPEACLGGRGFKTEKSTKVVTLFPGGKRMTFDVAVVVTMPGNAQTLTYYFYKSGEFIGSSYIKMRLNIALNKMYRDDTRGSLIRISTAITSGNESKAESRLVEFLEDLLPYIEKSL